MKILVAYYSLSGTTRTVATELAKALSADLEEIRCDRYSRGFGGYVRAASDSWRSQLPVIAPPEHQASSYDLVVVGGPLWAWSAAPPVRSYLRREIGRLPQVAFFMTHGGSSPQKALAQMTALAGASPKGTLVLREADVKAGKHPAGVSAFVAKLLQSGATLPHAA